MRTLFWLIRFLPARIAGGLGAGLGRLGYLFDKRHKNIALRNVQRVFPERALTFQKRIARESFAELGRVIFEMPHVFLRSEDFIRSRLNISGSDHLRKAASLGKGVIVIACHQANWEIGAMVPALLGYPSHNMYRTIRPQTADTYLRQLRSRFGIVMHARLDPSTWIPRALKMKSCLGFMFDQHVSEEFGVAAPFMGHLASTTTFPAQLAVKRNIPIVPITAFRRGRSFRFDVQIHPMIQPDREMLEADRKNTILKLTTRANEVLEKTIRKQPECWLWSHRRWRTLEHKTTR